MYTVSAQTIKISFENNKSWQDMCRALEALVNTDVQFNGGFSCQPPRDTKLLPEVL
jgi:hypothetical protein